MEKINYIIKQLEDARTHFQQVGLDGYGCGKKAHKSFINDGSNMKNGVFLLSLAIDNLNSISKGKVSTIEGG